MIGEPLRAALPASGIAPPMAAPLRQDSAEGVDPVERRSRKSAHPAVSAARVGFVDPRRRS